MTLRTFTARWVFPVAGPPLARGTVTVGGDRIESVDPAGVRAADEDLGDAAIIPGLVNAHTHLDLSGARGLISPTDPDHFTDWLRGVIAYRRARSPEQVQADIRAGLAESLRFGTTLLGDIAAGGASWDVVSGAAVRGGVFWELIGLTEERAKQSLEAATDWDRGTPETATCRKGFSPHAPYSARTSLIVGAGQLARQSDLKRPTAVHLGESSGELELLYHRRGPFVTFLKSLGVWDESGLSDSFDLVMSIGDFRQPKLFVHGNHLAPTCRVPRNGTIVYCPRTHAAFGHPPHPFRDFLKRGVRVALGTDSLASNPDLDLLAEARLVRERYPDVPGHVILRMATLAGAEALGWADECGSLEPGKSADFVAVPLPDREAADPHDLLLGPDAADGPRWTMFRGAWRDWV